METHNAKVHIHMLQCVDCTMSEATCNWSAREAVDTVVVIVGAEHVVSRINPFHWLIGIGLMLILVVSFLPKGLYSAIGKVAARVARAGRG